ncbi:hypothetical protein Hte_009471 [Hypoxylon texense]
MQEPRKLGLHQVYPDPNNISESNETNVDIVAIHGLDTNSPKAWVAWPTDGDPESGEVHWLQDDHMLPSVIRDARILTYDWNANFDKAAEVQTLAGHATVLLSKLHILRDKEDKLRPIIFVASCFGGLLLAKALHQASRARSKYAGILQATSGIAFLGTPFQGSHGCFYSATELRLAVATSMGAETSGELLKYLRFSNDGQLEELFKSFCELVYDFSPRIRIVCFYETHRTDFTKVIKDLPVGFIAQLKGETSGILVPKDSASLPGLESLGLSVRHSMLNKYASPEDESFKTVSSVLHDFATAAQIHIQEKLSLNVGQLSLLSTNQHQSTLEEALGNREILHPRSVSRGLADISKMLQRLSLSLGRAASETKRKTGIYEM